MASKFGVREICDVVLKAKAATKIGNRIFYANEPVMYFDTLKTSSMEGAATTVYAQGGRGNARLVAWEGERTVTFTMEDALISPEGFMILSGAGLVDATKSKPVYQHMTETIDINDVIFSDSTVTVDGEEGATIATTLGLEEGQFAVFLSEKPYLPTKGKENFAYVMLVKNGDVISEPYIPEHNDAVAENETITHPDYKGKYPLIIKKHDIYNTTENEADEKMYDPTNSNEDILNVPSGLVSADADFDSVLVDFYVARESDAQQIDITPDKFGGNYYLEASTLFRDQNGVDMPAEFIIPNCKIQSNFTFTMASSGDPSSFTFTMDAFPDYTRFDRSKKVLAAIQIIKSAGSQDLYRDKTIHNVEHEAKFI